MTTEADLTLIALLRENARASTADLARRLGVSRTTVQSRIEKLENVGLSRATQYESHLNSSAIWSAPMCS